MFFKTINFKVMKTIRTQLLYPIGVRLTIEGLIIEGIKKCRYSIFYAVTKRTTNRQQTENQLKFGRKRFLNRKAILWPSKYVGLNFLRAPIIYFVNSHQGN